MKPRGVEMAGVGMRRLEPKLQFVYIKNATSAEASEGVIYQPLD